MSLSKKKILFQLTGSIACYKACDLISKLIQSGYEVQTVCSPSALQFIGPATLEGLTGKIVVSDTFEHGKMMSHIELTRWADLLILCPATAHTVNNLAHGTLKGIIGELFLANNFQKPYWMAPAMNTQMFLNPITQSNLQKLQGLGVKVLDTDSGNLACGEVGKGRLLEPEFILNQIIETMPITTGGEL